MKLIDGEEKILTSDNGELVLTTHRVRLDTKSLGKRKITSLLLQELCSCELSHRSYPALLLVALIGFLVAVAGGSPDAMGIGVAITVISLISFFMTRKQALCLATAGAPIIVETKGMKPEKVKDFIDETEIAKSIMSANIKSV